MAELLPPISEIDLVLNQVLGCRELEYRQAPWLKSDFSAPLWRCVFGDTTQYTIDFRVRVNSKHLLTSSLHSSLLETLKCWLIAQTHPDTNNGVALGAGASNYRVYQTLHLIDYLLINADRLRIDRYGLEGLSQNDMYGLLLDLCKSNRTVYSVYQWPHMLSSFLLGKLNVNDKAHLDGILKANAWIADDIPDSDERQLTLTESQLAYARVWLWENGYYRPGNPSATNTQNYRYCLETGMLSREIYADTLRGQFQKPQILELNLVPTNRYKAEFRASPVTNIHDKRLSEKLFAQYLRSLNSLGQLAEIGLPVPITALDAIADRGFQATIGTKSIGRFKTLPIDAVFYALRQSIEFILCHGEAVVDATAEVLREVQAQHYEMEVEADVLHVDDIAKKHCSQLGVRYWSLTLQLHLREGNPNRHPDRKPGRENFYSRFRRNEGLWELILVLYGAVQVCVGALMARRQQELRKLIAGKALDKTGRHLIFRNGKSGVLDIRKSEARPIPEIGAKAIGLLERLQDKLLEYGVIHERTNVFSYPKQRGIGLVVSNSTTYGRCFDAFCDYIESQLDSEERRYYIRQHQLRRFFAMLFFWGNSFGGMDTLRWFLGHTDIEHLYHYITESTSGEVLSSVKAQFAVERLQQEKSDSEALRHYLQERFGTAKFSVLDAEELDEYVEELILEGRVTVEPEFFTGSDNKNYRILIKVIPQPASPDER